MTTAGGAVPPLNVMLPTDPNSAAVGIGRHVSGIVDPFNGHIDEFRIPHLQRSDGWSGDIADRCPVYRSDRHHDRVRAGRRLMAPASGHRGREDTRDRAVQSAVELFGGLLSDKPLDERPREAGDHPVVARQTGVRLVP